MGGGRDFTKQSESWRLQDHISFNTGLNFPDSCLQLLFFPPVCDIIGAQLNNFCRLTSFKEGGMERIQRTPSFKLQRQKKRPAKQEEM